MNENRRTSIYQLHLELGAKMVPFAGYQMPLQYKKGIIHEHLYTRSHAGFFDISHMGQIYVSGETAAKELEHLTPSNISGLKPGRQQYTVFTNEDGGIIDDLIVTNIDSRFFIVVNAVCKEKDLSHLKSSLSAMCDIESLEHQSLFALQGPLSAEIMRKFSDTAANLSFMTACYTKIDGIPCLVSRCGYTGEDGFEISVADEHTDQLARIFLAEEHVEPVGLGARDTLRIEAGLCLYGHELTESITPVEAKLEWIIKNRHHQYPGEDIIVRQLQDPPGTIRTGVKPEGKVLVRQGTEIINSEGTTVGLVTSGSFGPSAGHPVAMANIQSKEAFADNRLFAKIRNQQIPIHIVSLPFIPHRYHRNS